MGVQFVCHRLSILFRLNRQRLRSKGGRCVLSGSVSDVFKNCDVIEDAGLKLPEITHFANTLYSEGICDIRGSLSVEEAFEKMQVLLGSKKC